MRAADEGSGRAAIVGFGHEVVRCTTRRSSAARPGHCVRPDLRGYPLANAASCSGVMPSAAGELSMLAVEQVDAAERRHRTARARCARWCRTPAARRLREPLITRRISLVAVCCSSASVRSRLRASSSVNSRTFSIAMTAWSAKVCSSAIWLSGNGPGSGRPTAIPPIGASFAHQRHGQNAAEAAGHRSCPIAGT